MAHDRSSPQRAARTRLLLRALLAGALLVPGLVAAGTLVLPYTFSNDTVADANQVNANFAAARTANDDNHARVSALEARAPLVVQPAGTAAASCKALKTAKPDAPSGIYWLRPIASAAPFPAYCDMESDGGGWTLFYASRNARPRAMLHSVDVSDCPDPRWDCARRIPSDRTETNTEYASSCGTAMVKFRGPAGVTNFFKTGAQTTYHTLTNVAAVYGTVPQLPDQFYTGPSNPGWFLQKTPGSGTLVFSSGYSGGYDGCNYVADYNSHVTLFWREL